MLRKRWVTLSVVLSGIAVGVPSLLLLAPVGSLLLLPDLVVGVHLVPISRAVITVMHVLCMGVQRLL